MKKTISALAVCMLALALCLGLLPTAALAADGIEIYVGGQLITESGCYENQGGTWTKVDGTEPAAGQFYYDAATITLTLNGAEISHDQVVNLGGNYFEGSVIAYSQTADVSLNIVIPQGTSTITGAGGIRVQSDVGGATLSVFGPGSLTVDVSGANSAIMLDGSADLHLNIDGADVTALAGSVYGHHGVYMHSDCESTSTSAVTVKNGSLTISQSGEVGIHYYWAKSGGTSKLTVSGNAVVDTGDSRILTGSGEVQIGAGSDGTGGIVRDSTSGTVYGDMTLQDNLEIKSGERLTVDSDASLTVPEGTTLTNNGTINNNGTMTNSGTVTNNGTLTNDGTVNVESGANLTNNGSLTNNGNGAINTSGTLTTENGIMTNDGTINIREGGTMTGAPNGGAGAVVNAPVIITASLPGGTVGAAYNQALAADNNPTSWSVTTGALPDGLTLNNTTGEITGVPGKAGSFSFTVKALNSAGSYSSSLTITVTPRAPAPTPAPSYDWNSVLTSIRGLGGKGSLRIDVGSELSVPHFIWQEIYGKNITLTFVRGSESYVVNGLTLKNINFDPNSGHMLAEFTAARTNPNTGVKL